jgi:hypothetical protein
MQVVQAWPPTGATTSDLIYLGSIRNRRNGREVRCACGPVIFSQAECGHGQRLSVARPAQTCEAIRATSLPTEHDRRRHQPIRKRLGQGLGRETSSGLPMGKLEEALPKAGLIRRKASSLPSLCGISTIRGSDIGVCEASFHSTSSRERPARTRSPRPRPRWPWAALSSICRHTA